MFLELNLHDYVFTASRYYILRLSDEEKDGTGLEWHTNNSKRAWVMAIYKDNNGNEIKFQRRFLSDHTIHVNVYNACNTY